MQNKALLRDAQFFSPHTRPSIDEDRVIAGYRHTGYREGDLLLDIIKQGLVAKRIAIGGYRQHRPTLQRSESDHATSDEGTWGRGRAVCRRAGEPVERIERVAGGIEAKEVAH